MMSVVLRECWSCMCCRFLLHSTCCHGTFGLTLRRALTLRSLFTIVVSFKIGRFQETVRSSKSYDPCCNLQLESLAELGFSTSVVL